MVKQFSYFRCKVVRNEFIFFQQLNNLTYEELQERMKLIDPEMEREIDELRRRYEAKRAPILLAIDAKKRRQQNF